mgnify:CR=1 FL=1
MLTGERSIYWKLTGRENLDYFAALYHVRTGSHGATDLSPITQAAAVHLDLTVPNFGIQEYMGHRDPAGELFSIQELLRGQYAAVGAASRAALASVISTLEQAEERGADVSGLLESYAGRAGMVNRYVDAYRRYCWPVASVDDLRLAPFHLLATEGRVHTDKDHVWHMETLGAVCAADARGVGKRNRPAGGRGCRCAARGCAWWRAPRRGCSGSAFARSASAFTARWPASRSDATSYRACSRPSRRAAAKNWKKRMQCVPPRKRGGTADQTTSAGAGRRVWRSFR